MKERIGNLLKAINRGLYEKETETALSLLAAIAARASYCSEHRVWQSRWWQDG